MSYFYWKLTDGNVQLRCVTVFYIIVYRKFPDIHLPLKLDVLRLNNSRYEKEFIEKRLLGQGAFGSVFEVSLLLCKLQLAGVTMTLVISLCMYISLLMEAND